MARMYGSSKEQYGIELLHATGMPAKNRYAEKQMSVGLSIEDDPFLPKNSNRFANSLSNWPQTEFGLIFTSFLSRACVYTQKQLLSWKQMDAYIYFQ